MRRAFRSMCVAGLASVGTISCAPPAAPPTTPPPPSSALLDRPASGATTRPIAASAAPAAAPAPAPAPAAGNDVVARVGTQTITKDELLQPMIEAHGLNFLIQIVQLDLAKQTAAQKGITVTADDVKEERKLTFQRMFRESDEALREKLKEAEEKDDTETANKIKAELNADREGLLDQYLVQQFAQTGQYLSKQEFALAMEVHAYCRKIAQADPNLDKAITEDILRKHFAAKYGEKVVVRHIQANDALTLQKAKNRLDAGENFADVATAMSVNRHTAPLGGAITPFTMTAPNVPDLFKQVAFSLKVGEVSDVINSDNAWHLIKVESRIEPKLVKYEDVKESLRAELYDQILQAQVQRQRAILQSQMMANMKIENPTLKAQFDAKAAQAKKDRAELDAEMKRNRAATGGGATTAPAGPAAPAPVAPDLTPAN